MIVQFPSILSLRKQTTEHRLHSSVLQSVFVGLLQVLFRWVWQRASTQFIWDLGQWKKKTTKKKAVCERCHTHTHTHTHAHTHSSQVSGSSVPPLGLLWVFNRYSLWHKGPTAGARYTEKDGRALWKELICYVMYVVIFDLPWNYTFFVKGHKTRLTFPEALLNKLVTHKLVP